MARLLPLLLVATVVACHGVDTGSFSVLTYNVAGLPEGISGSNPSVNTASISPMLNRYDVVGVQEDFTYHEELYRQTDHAHRTEPDLAQSGLGDGLNILSRFRLSDVERIPWGQCSGADCLTPKGFMFARLHLGPDLVIDVVNLHHQAGSTPPALEARAANVQQLIDAIQRWSPEGPLLLIGDTNLHFRDEADVPHLTRMRTDLGLIDACLDLACGEDIIDRIYIRSGEQVLLKARTWRVAKEFGTTKEDMLSDHLAINSRIDWSLP